MLLESTLVPAKEEIKETRSSAPPQGGSYTVICTYAWSATYILGNCWNGQGKLTGVIKIELKPQGPMVGTKWGELGASYWRCRDGTLIIEDVPLLEFGDRKPSIRIHVRGETDYLPTKLREATITGRIFGRK